LFDHVIFLKFKFFDYFLSTIFIVAMHRNKWKIRSLSARTSYKLVSTDLPYRVFRDSTFPRDEERRWCTQVDKNLPRWPMSVECVPSSGSTSRVSRRDKIKWRLIFHVPLREVFKPGYDGISMR